MGVVTRVKRIATQGRYDANQWVKSYTLSYSNNGIRFIPYRRGRRVQVIGSFSIEDGDDSENVKFAFFHTTLRLFQFAENVKCR